MTDPSTTTPQVDTGEQYKKLLRGEISSAQYVKVVKEKVQASREATATGRSAAIAPIRRRLGRRTAA